MASLFKFFTIVTALCSATLLAKNGSFRENRKLGVSFGHHSPAPMHGGVTLHAYPAKFMSLELGGGLLIDSGQGVLGKISNTMMTSMAYLMTLGLIPYSDIYKFLSGEEATALKYAFGWGGGTRFFIPHWDLSPNIGIHWISLESHNGALGLADKTNHFYATGGLEWQTPIGFFLSGGLAFLPSLPLSHRYLGYFQLGTAF